MASLEPKSSQFQLIHSVPGLYQLHWRNRLIASLTHSELDFLARRVSIALSKAASLSSPAPIHIPCNSEAILRLTLPEATELLLMCVAKNPELAHNRSRSTRHN